METLPEIAPDETKSERAAPSPGVVGSRGPSAACPICEKPLSGRQTSACSNKHRAAKSRRQRVRLRMAEAQAIRANLIRALEIVWEAKATLDKYVGG